VTPNVKVLKVAPTTGGPCYEPNVKNVYEHTYPMSRYVYIYVNRKPASRWSRR